jgi:hypothetical protein
MQVLVVLFLSWKIADVIPNDEVGWPRISVALLSATK